jgi:hypothetical protein
VQIGHFSCRICIPPKNLRRICTILLQCTAATTTVCVNAYQRHQSSVTSKYTKSKRPKVGHLFHSRHCLQEFHLQRQAVQAVDVRWSGSHCSPNDSNHSLAHRNLGLLPLAVCVTGVAGLYVTASVWSAYRVPCTRHLHVWKPYALSRLLDFNHPVRLIWKISRLD